VSRPAQRRYAAGRRVQAGAIRPAGRRGTARFESDRLRPMPRSRRPHPPADVREACVEAAHAVIAEHGIEALSLRDVARRLGVSHQAPYKHFPTRDHLLAEVIRRCFQRLATALGDRPAYADPADAMRGLGEAYLRFALAHPLEYRLMFGTPWPSVADHPDLLRDARLAFEVLRGALAQVAGPQAPAERIDLDAMFVWSAVHGLATILQSNVMSHLVLHPSARQALIPHVMRTIDAALEQRQAAAPRKPSGR